MEMKSLFMGQTLLCKDFFPIYIRKLDFREIISIIFDCIL